MWIFYIKMNFKYVYKKAPISKGLKNVLQLHFANQKIIP